MAKIIIAPLFLIMIGVGWVLSVEHVLPMVNWIFVLMLGTAGLSILLVKRLTRSSIIAGPFLMLWALLTFLKQVGTIDAELEMPVLVILFGVLLLISRMAPLPERADPPNG
jgi:succinate-acetate transporter protein